MKKISGFSSTNLFHSAAQLLKFIKFKTFYFCVQNTRIGVYKKFAIHRKFCSLAFGAKLYINTVPVVEVGTIAGTI